MTFFNGANAFVNAFDDELDFNHYLAGAKVDDAKREGSSNQLQDGLVSTTSWSIRPPSLNSANFSGSFPYQESTQNGPIIDNHLGFLNAEWLPPSCPPLASQTPSFIPLSTNTRLVSSTTTPVTSQFPAGNASAFNSQCEQGQLVTDSLGLQNLFFPAAISLTADMSEISNAFSAAPVSQRETQRTESIAADRGQLERLSKPSQAITASGGLHLCRKHHNLIQSFAEYKPEVIFVNFDSSKCIICTSQRQPSARNVTDNSRIRPRVNHSSNARSAQPQNRFYCSWLGCNRAEGAGSGDDPFNRNDNKNEHEHRVHGLPRRKLRRAGRSGSENSDDRRGDASMPLAPAT